MSEEQAMVEAPDQSWLAAAIPAGFWRRVAARLIDMLIVSPITLTLVLATGSSRDVSIVADVLGLLIVQSYTILSLYLWCQTPGKMIMGVRVVSLDGDRLSLVQSVLRSSIEAGIAILIVAFTAIGKLRISRSDFSALGLVERNKFVGEVMPQLKMLSLLNALWFAVGGIVLIYTFRKRAPHDFIAGTRVVRDLADGDEAEAGVKT